MEQCKHEPDVRTLTIADELTIKTDDDEVQFVIDVTCKHCGCSGSFGVIIPCTDINW